MLYQSDGLPHLLFKGEERGGDQMNQDEADLKAACERELQADFTLVEPLKNLKSHDSHRPPPSISHSDKVRILRCRPDLTDNTSPSLTNTNEHCTIFIKA